MHPLAGRNPIQPLKGTSTLLQLTVRLIICRYWQWFLFNLIWYQPQWISMQCNLLRKSHRNCWIGRKCMIDNRSQTITHRSQISQLSSFRILFRWSSRWPFSKELWPQYLNVFFVLWRSQFLPGWHSWPIDNNAVTYSSYRVLQFSVWTWPDK